MDMFTVVAEGEYDASTDKLTAKSTLNNTVAREGYDRCACGCKYWENDRCIDCGDHVFHAVKEDES